MDKNQRGSQPPSGPDGKVPLAQLLVWAGLFIALLVWAGLEPEQNVKTVSYSEMKDLIGRGTVASVVLEQHAITATDVSGGGTGQVRAVLPPQDDPGLLPLLESQAVKIEARPPRGSPALLYMLPWLMLLLVYFLIQRSTLSQLGGGLGGSGAAGLFGGRYSRPSETRPDFTFDDVAGQDEAKREVSELVDFLREPERFSKVGAEVPHGVLLMGPPGTGKTLLARALAGEADVPFFSTSGSEFIEVFVGVGAGRVRKMFEAARKAAPAVIFIDELDSIGRTRGTGLGGGHDEREQTLNQILAELDGFEGKEAVVVLAATNRPDVLDPALLRPGRFDRHVTLTLPDTAARLAILEIHARGLPLSDPGDLEVIAAGTPGFSGADLKNLLNEAAINAARQRAETVTGSDLQEARDKVMMGTVRTLAIRPEERHRLAVHEAGHTAAAYYTEGADPLYKVTIIPRGRSLGGTHMLTREEHHTLPEDYLHAQLVVLLAGHAAERLLLGSVSSGADDDIKRATALARSMVARWGMTEELGPVDLRQSEDHPFLGQSVAQPREHADHTAARADRAVMALLKEARSAAERTLEAHRSEVALLVRELESKETLDFGGIEACLASGGKVQPLTPRPPPAAPKPGSGEGGPETSGRTD